MATTGTSVLGLQTLLTASSGPNKLLSIGMTGTPVPPALRVGYFYLYQFSTITPFQSYVVESGPIYAPGILIPIRVGLLSGTFAWRLDAVWNYAGRTWGANIA
jgi:hypothetical protein